MYNLFGDLKMYSNLIQAAKVAAQKSTSQNKSGAALLSKDGDIYCGTSVGEGIFAEAVCLANAVADTKQKFLALAVFADGARGIDKIAAKNLLEFGDMWVITCFDNKTESTLLSKLAR